MVLPMMGWNHLSQLTIKAIPHRWASKMQTAKEFTRLCFYCVGKTGTFMKDQTSEDGRGDVSWARNLEDDLTEGSPWVL